MLFAFAECELDLPRHELRRGGIIVHVEPQVFDLLVFLITNRERIVSKDEILDAVWNGRIVSEAALSSRINAARKAVGDNGNDQSLIRTFQKRGFRFIGEVTTARQDSASRVATGRDVAPGAAELAPAMEKRGRRGPAGPRSPSSPFSTHRRIPSTSTSPTV
jgi:DNA-binding winged helix-turn-helix (wHTH) protein